MSSLWLQDIECIKFEGVSKDWYLRGVVCSLLSGQSIRIWHNNWCGGILFKLLFPEAFSMCNNHDAIV